MSTYRLDRLDNGLRILTAPMPSAQSVTCAIMLAAGSRYETPDTNGIAHFSEHMFFKGTEKRPTARDISKEIDAIGGEFNAFTGKEYTGYYVKCAAESRDVALDVLVDMLRNAKFAEDEIEREKGVIIEEMNMYFDTPRDFIGGVYEELLYGDQPLGWDIIGRKETVRSATHDTFREYVERWYKPERMVFGVNHSYTDAGSLFAQAGVDINRIDDAVTTIAAEIRKVAEEPIPADELEKARSFAKGRFVLQLESPQGLIMFGLRREVLESDTPDPEEILAELDKVTADDVKRVARNLIDGQGLNLAVIGPFDDAERFEKLLA